MEDVSSAYMKDVGRHEVLDNEEINLLIAEAQKGDITSRDRIITHNMRLVIKISKKYINRGLEQPDLISEGVFGLIHAIKKFDPEKAKFTTYCGYWIESYMDRASMDKGRTIRIPIHRNVLHRKLIKLSKEFENKTGMSPRVEYLSNVMEIEQDAVRKLIYDYQSILSLDFNATSEYNKNDECDPLITFIESDPEDFGENLDKERSFQKVYDSIKKLSARHQQVLSLRFGLNGCNSHTFEMTGKVMGVSRERVRQIQEAALISLKDTLSKESIF